MSEPTYTPSEEAPVYCSQPVRIEDIIETLHQHHPEADVTAVQRAYIYAAGAHQGMVRRSGEPYLNHPLAVAGILCDMKLDVPTIVAGLLHDTIEDTEATFEDIAEKFGTEVATIVDGVTKISKMNFSSATERKAKNMRKMILAMLTDLRVILVKLADRLNNMRTLGFMTEAKQIAISMETRDLFAPLASRLGIHKIQTELENLCLFYLEPTAYSEIRSNLSAGRHGRQDYVKEVTRYLEQRIQEFQITAQIEGRSKHIYSIWKKMRDQNLTFDQIYDLTAFRIVVGDFQDCYGTLGVVHSIFKAIPGRFKDYINLPKANGYQSLHTAVIGPRNTRMEVQIRTHEMHNYAENGIAAHWRYKDGGTIANDEEKRILALKSMQSVLSWQENLDDPDVFLTSVRDSLADYKSIYVFTPMGEVKELPLGSGPIDFAYSIHSMVGQTCAGVKINGSIAPLRYKLKNGDTVEIMTNRNNSPSRDWLDYTVSPRAKARIRQWFASEEKVKAVDFGHTLLEKEMRRARIPKAKLNNQELLKALGFNTLDELNAAVAFGKMSVRRIMEILAPDKFKTPVSESSISSGAFASSKNSKASKDSSIKDQPDISRNILVSGMNDIFLRLAKCCSPLPGEPIVGYIAQGTGVSIHSATCSSLAGLDPERFVQASWAGYEDSLFDIYTTIHTTNDPGIALRIIQVLLPLVGDISDIHSGEDESGDRFIRLKLKVNSHDQLDKIIKTVSQLSQVKQIYRTFPEKIWKGQDRRQS